MHAYNTLGAIYERRGMSRNAETVFEYVLAQEPRNVNVMSNLVATLKDQGRIAEANSWSRDHEASTTRNRRSASSTADSKP